MQRTITAQGEISARELTVDAPLGRLHVVYPPGLEVSFTVQSRATLGREPGDATPPLEEPTVSRRHLAIEADASGARWVTDLGSRNGSWVDGRRLGGGREPLPHEGVLRVGNVLLVYEAAPLGGRLPWIEPTLATGAVGPVSHEAIPGHSAAAHRLRAAVARAAPDLSPVLVCGETGTGKELIAAEIHRLSGRRGARVALNCAALSPQLVESQLFGHVRGAFTGAEEAHQGLVRAASGGTLFLDEIGELSPPLQAKLLRLIQEHEVQPVGSSRAVKVDVRIVAATNRDLAAAVDAGTFRRDLYARLTLLVVPVPPLRERRADILAWVARLHRRWQERRNLRASALELDPTAAEALLLHPWPENLRGVDRLVHELGTLRGVIGPDQLPPWLFPAAPAAAPDAPAARPAPPTKEQLAAALAELGSVRATAKYFGKDRRQIYRWLEAYGMRGE